MSNGIFEENGYRLWWAYYEKPLKPGEASDEVRKLLERIMPGAVENLDKTPTGKPFFIHSSLCVSISHAPHMVAVAIAPFSIGLDVEAPHARLLRIQERVFNVQECLWAQHDLLKLTSLWTAREALYKLDGQRGLDFRKDMGTNANEKLPLPNKGWIRREDETQGTHLFYHSIQHHLFCIARYRDYSP